MKLKENRFLIILIVLGAVLFYFVATVLLATNKKVTAVVPVGDIEASTIITDVMVQEIEVPADTPGTFIKSKSTVVGSRLKNGVTKDQLLYESDFMSSWADYTESTNVPDDYIITNIAVPDERAVGGLITSGDLIDVMIVMSKDKDSHNTDEEQEAANTWLNNTNTNANYVLANVLVLSTDSALAASQESDLSSVESNGTTSGGSEDTSNYIVALSYNDYMKFRIANSSSNAEIWLNIAPQQNKDKSPLIAQMSSKKFAYLHDAQKQVMDEEGNMLVEDYYETTDDGTLVDNASSDLINFSDGTEISEEDIEEILDVVDSEEESKEDSEESEEESK